MNQTVSLRLRTEFEAALENYAMSPHAQQILDTTQLVIMLGVFGSGRNTIIDKLLTSGDYHFIISDTTRPPKIRNGQLEQHGVQYFFRTEEEMLQDIKKGEFLEAEIIHEQQVSGISIRELEKAKLSGKIPINEVDIEGSLNILKAKPDTVMIFIVPPSFEEWVRRISEREQMDAGEFNNRIKTAQKIFRIALSDPRYKFVLNDQVSHAASQVNALVTAGIHKDDDHEAARAIAGEIAIKVDEFIATIQ